MTQVLLVNPPIYDFAAYDLWMKPLGFLVIARLLLENGFKVEFFDFLDRHYPGYRTADRPGGCGKFPYEVVLKPDCYQTVPRVYKRFGLPREVFCSFLAGLKKPELILVCSGMTYWYPGVKEVVNTCRQFFPGVPIILGGTYATLCPSHARTTGADIIFSGKQLNRFIQLMESLTGQTFRLRPNFWLTPAWELYPRLSYLCLKTSFGCPFRCSYCASSLLEPEIYQRQPEEVAREILFLVEKHRVNQVAFYDDALLFKFDQHLRRILAKLQGQKIFFHTPNGLNINDFTPETGWILKEAGFVTIRLSLESSQPETVASAHKVSFKKFEQLITWLSQAGFTRKQIGVYILAGWPGQQPEEVKQTIIVLKNYPCQVKLAEYSPIPGTSAFNLCQKLHPDLGLTEPLLHNNSLFPAWNFKGKWDIIREIKELVNS
ncbi:MAG: radical SAM protein [Candidatus Omnitrophica bacterium]|nr:radical SAM protein [Candidatus Omnitrophota bacterium]